MHKEVSRSILAVIFVGTLGLAACRKDGAREVQLAVDAMRLVKTLRMASNSPERTWEFVCPERIRFVDVGTDYEEIDIGKKFFLRGASGKWVQKPESPTGGLGCDLWLVPLIGRDGQLRRDYDFRYLGTDKAGGETCDSWAALDQQYPRPKDGGLLDGIDIIVCIHPANHLVLQLKQGNQFRRFSNFNEAVIIEEPPVSPAEGSTQRGSPEAAAGTQ